MTETSTLKNKQTVIQRNPLISNDHVSDEILLLSGYYYYPHFHFRYVDSKKSALTRK